MNFISFFLISFFVFVNSSCASSRSVIDFKKSECFEDGWKEVSFKVGEQNRRLLYKGPSGPWQNGAILVLHGGGGQAEHFCDQSIRLVRPQARFTKMAIEQKFGVFILESTDQVTDNEGKICGKIWDDEVRNRPNLDLPYLEKILKEIVPVHRPSGSKNKVYMTGLSSGGYMTVRAATHFGSLISAFAPLSNGDPYGWHRKCDPQYGNSRDNVKGGGFDNETQKEIIKENSCLSDSYPNEKKWDETKGEKPPFRLFHSEFDGINDYSCHLKVEKQLKQHGFTGEASYLMKNHSGRRRLIYHFWADEYNPEILEFFKRH